MGILTSNSRVISKVVNRVSKFPGVENLDKELDNIVKQVIGLFEESELTVLSKTGAYGLKDSDSIIVITNGITVDLPAKTSEFTIKVRYIKNIGTADATVRAQSGSLIDTQQTLTLTQFETAAIIPYNNNWYII